MEYKRFTEEQKEKARNADIINFLGSYMGFEFKQAGKYYQCKQHNSLVVYPNRKGFVWNSRNISGGDCIDFLNKVEGKNFFEAIETIIGENASVTYQPAPQYKSEKSQLELPEPTTDKYSRVFAYLSQTRGISADVIFDFIRSKQIYQDTRGNCVFVGRDENGVERFGCIRGTLTEKKYRGDCKNSDKRYAFRQIGEDTTFLLTHLMRGVTIYVDVIGRPEQISTHTPHARCDYLTFVLHCLYRHFYSHTSCEV